MKIFITHNCARASWPSSPHLATFLPSFGHVWETIFSSVFLTELFHHISFGCFHSTCSQEQCFLMKKGVVCGWIGAIKKSLGLGWVGANYGKPMPSSRCILLTNDASDGPIRSEHALLSTNGKPELSAPADQWNKKTAATIQGESRGLVWKNPTGFLMVNPNQTIAWQVRNCSFILAGGRFSWN